MIDGVWLNEPRRWRRGSEGLDLTTDDRTDFWRETHYGFIRDNGHFFGLSAAGSFTAQVRVRARYEHLYDQAGLMIRLNERQWIKAGLELSDGQIMLSSVLTDGRSDWATARYDGDPEDFRIRASLERGVVRIQVSSAGEAWRLMRLAPFPEAAGYRVGPMACTPERAGLTVSFLELAVGPALAKDLHDTT